jgi:sortase B
LKKKVFYAAAAVLIILAAACFAAHFMLRASGTRHIEPPAPPSPPPVTAAPTPTPTQPPEESEPPEEEYVSPIDFDALAEINPDIYAWLEIPGTDISYPVLQSENDAFYLDHDENKNYSPAGSIFSESAYNGRDFSDPVTLLYGHRMSSGAMFGQLQKLYSDPEKFSELNEFVIYLPDREIHYKVFAAVPLDKRHILYSYDFGSARQFKSFFNEIFDIRAIGSNIDKDAKPSYDSQVVILSTCLMGDRTCRFLVMGSHEPEDPEAEDNAAADQE